MSPDELGRFIRAERRRQELRQGELAALAGVGNRFLSDLEGTQCRDYQALGGARR